MAKFTQTTKLGTLAIYSLDGQVSVKIQDLRDSAKNFGVPYGLIPNPLSDEGAFRRATTLLSEKMGKEEPILVKEVLSDKDVIVRVIEKRLAQDDIDAIIAEQENKPHYAHVATMTFAKATSAITYKLISACGEPLVRRAIAEYKRLAGAKFNITQIRRMIQDAFVYYDGIQFRKNGGVTFIPEYKVDDFMNFVKMCDSIDGIELFTIDMKYSANNHQQVMNNLNEQIYMNLEDEIKALSGKTIGSKALSDMVTDFSEALLQGTAKQTKLTNMVERFKKTKELVKGYQDLLCTDLSLMDEQLDIASKQLVKILNASAEEEAKAN